MEKNDPPNFGRKVIKKEGVGERIGRRLCVCVCVCVWEGEDSGLRNVDYDLEHFNLANSHSSLLPFTSIRSMIQ